MPLLALLALAATLAWTWRLARLRIAPMPAIQELRRPPPSSLRLSTVFSPPVLRWEPAILRWSASTGLDPQLIATVIQIESCGDPRAISSSGALGLFQVMPFHFDESEDPLDVETNAARGLAYLSRAVELAGGRVDLALAGYNGGHGVIHRPPAEWPAETRRYVRWGGGILGEVAEGMTDSPTLQAWRTAGGGRLCQSAERIAPSP